MGRKTGKNRVSGAAARSNAERTRAALASQGATPNDIWAAGGFADGPDPLPRVNNRLINEKYSKEFNELLNAAITEDVAEIEKVYASFPKNAQKALREYYDSSIASAQMTPEQVAGRAKYDVQTRGPQPSLNFTPEFIDRVDLRDVRDVAEQNKSALLSQGARPNTPPTPVDALFGGAPVLPAMGGMAADEIEQLKTRIGDLAKRGDIKGIDALFDKLPKDVKQFLQPAYDKMREAAIDSAVKSTNDASAQAKAMGATDESLAAMKAAELESEAAAGGAALAGPLGSPAERLTVARPQVVSALEAHLKETGKLPTDSKEFRALLVKMGAPAEAVENAAWPTGLKATFGPEKRILGQMKELNQLWTKAAPDEAVRKSVAGAAAKELNQIFNPLIDGFQKGTTRDLAAMNSLLKNTKGMLGKQFVGEAGDILGVFSKHPILSSIGVGLVGIAADQMLKTGLSAMQPVPEETMLKTMPTPEQAVADDLANELHQEQMMRTVANYYPEQASSIIDSLLGGGRAAAPQGPAVDPNSPALPTELSSYGR